MINAQSYELVIVANRSLLSPLVTASLVTTYHDSIERRKIVDKLMIPGHVTNTDLALVWLAENHFEVTITSVWERFFAINTSSVAFPHSVNVSYEVQLNYHRYAGMKTEFNATIEGRGPTAFDAIKNALSNARYADFTISIDGDY